MCSPDSSLNQVSIYIGWMFTLDSSVNQVTRYLDWWLLLVWASHEVNVCYGFDIYCRLEPQPGHYSLWLDVYSSVESELGEQLYKLDA